MIGTYLVNWIKEHKALLLALAAALTAAAPVVPPPYNGILIGLATVLGAVAGGQLAVKAALKSQS